MTNRSGDAGNARVGVGNSTTPAGGASPTDENIVQQELRFGDSGDTRNRDPHTQAAGATAILVLPVEKMLA